MSPATVFLISGIVRVFWVAEAGEWMSMSAAGGAMLLEVKRADRGYCLKMLRSRFGKESRVDAKYLFSDTSFAMVFSNVVF